MWLSDVSYYGANFHGTLANEPVNIVGIEMGDRLDVVPEDVSDWLIIREGTLLGGFTIHGLRSRMTDQERAEFDRTLPYTIQDEPLLP